jgi:hypothetical protein
VLRYAHEPGRRWGLQVSTYETFYPEKRPFFLEGAELFAAPIQALYTRRIGRLPDVPAVPDGETVRPVQDPSRLWSAAKLTGTAGSDTQIGALAAVTGENRVTTEDASGTHERVVDRLRRIAREARARRARLHRCVRDRGWPVRDPRLSDDRRCDAVSRWRHGRGRRALHA